MKILPLNQVLQGDCLEVMGTFPDESIDMVEFCSHLENLIVAEELRFNPTPSFGQYKPFLEQAIAHPAKMNTKLLKFLIEQFTKEGDTVLDPMCGSGSTGVVAAVHGRNAVQVDIEEKFVKWAEEARAKVERQAVLSSKGNIRNVCGDARRLSELLKEADIVLTSPPYSNTISKHAGGKCTLERLGITTKTARSYDVIVTSPPYGDTNDKKGRKPDSTRGIRNRALDLPENPENIGNLSFQVDTVITSPPYGEAQDGHGIAKEGYRGKKHSPTDLVGNRSYMPDKFEKPENIRRLPFGNVDAIITSPPYGESAAFHDVEFMKSIQRDLEEKVKKGENKGHLKTEEAGKRNFEKMQEGNIESDNNIGNLAKETYMEAMLKVYSEMFKVLKANGLAIIVIKPFIRRKKVVDLPWHTWLLLQKVGFKLAKLYKLRLKQDSFWRILYRKKYPRVPEIKHEYVIVTQK